MGKGWSSFPSVKNAVPCRGTDGLNPASSSAESAANPGLQISIARMRPAEIAPGRALKQRKRSPEAAAYLARNWKFESISLQQPVCLSSEP